MGMTFYETHVALKNSIYECTLKQFDNVIVISLFIGIDDIW